MTPSGTGPLNSIVTASTATLGSVFQGPTALLGGSREGGKNLCPTLIHLNLCPFHLEAILSGLWHFHPGGVGRGNSFNSCQLNHLCIYNWYWPMIPSLWTHCLIILTLQYMPLHSPLWNALPSVQSLHIQYLKDCCLFASSILYWQFLICWTFPAFLVISAADLHVACFSSNSLINLASRWFL